MPTSAKAKAGPTRLQPFQFFAHGPLHLSNIWSNSLYMQYSASIFVVSASDDSSPSFFTPVTKQAHFEGFIGSANN